MTDEGQRPPARGSPEPTGAPGPEQERGRGLLIIDAPADRWGTGRTSGGLMVWAEVITDMGSGAL